MPSADDWRSAIKYDHEHPCPSARCVEVMRKNGVDVPDGVDCCICWRYSTVDSLSAEKNPEPKPGVN